MPPKRKEGVSALAAAPSSKRAKKPVSNAVKSKPKHPATLISSDDEGANAELPGNDVEYIEKKRSRSVRTSGTKALPPPLSTRSHKTKAANPEEDTDANDDEETGDDIESGASEDTGSPTPPPKKSRGANVPASAPSRRSVAAPKATSKSTSSKERKSSKKVVQSEAEELEEEDTEPEPVEAKKGKVHHKKQPVSATGREEDEDDAESAVEEVSPTVKKNSKRRASVSRDEGSDPDEPSDEGDEYLEEHGMLRVRKLPAECSVSRLANMDSLLLDYGSYNGLPKLKRAKGAAYNEAYSTMEDGSQLAFHKWPGQAPKMSMKIAAAFISFAREGRYVNISRVHPFEIFGRLLSNSTTSWELVVKEGGSYQPALCLTPIGVSESHTIRPGGTVTSTSISGFLHEHEFDRFVGLMGMLCETPVVHLRVYQTALSFMAQPPKATNPVRTSFGNMFASGGSPFRGSRPKPDSSAFELLRHDARIPVYDARKKKSLNITPSLLQKPENTLPLYDGDIRPGSFAVVCHTTAISKRVIGDTDKWSLFFAPQWVILVGEPGAA